MESARVIDSHFTSLSLASLLMEPRDRKVDIALALRAYQTVVDHGERDEEGFVYKGLRASTDFDGYTVTLSDGTISLQIYFHNRFSIEPSNGRAIDRFLALLHRVAEAKSPD
jgi:flavin-dependent dehydrogenase